MKTAAAEPDSKAQLVQEAWIGDAVLSLYARARILREDGVLDGEKCVRMTSNQFLGTLGEPTRIEAEVGRVYARDGLEAAFAWIEQRILPMFEKQEANRSRKAAARYPPHRLPSRAAKLAGGRREPRAGPVSTPIAKPQQR